MSKEVEFEEIQGNEKKSKKWSEMTGMQKTMFVVKAILSLLGIGMVFAGGWAARGVKDKSIHEKAAKYDELQNRKTGNQNSGSVNRPGMVSKPQSSNFTGNSGVTNRSAEQLLIQ